MQLHLIHYTFGATTVEHPSHMFRYMFRCRLLVQTGKGHTETSVNRISVSIFKTNKTLLVDLSDFALTPKGKKTNQNKILYFKMFVFLFDRDVISVIPSSFSF